MLLHMPHTIVLKTVQTEQILGDIILFINCRKDKKQNREKNFFLPAYLRNRTALVSPPKCVPEAGDSKARDTEEGRATGRHLDARNPLQSCTKMPECLGWVQELLSLGPLPGRQFNWQLNRHLIW